MYLVKLGDICSLTRDQKKYKNIPVDLDSDAVMIAHTLLSIYSVTTGTIYNARSRINQDVFLTYTIKKKYLKLTKEELVVKLDMEGKKIYVLGQAR